MFTGIVEETGIIKRISHTSSGVDMEVECSKVLEGTQIGDSIAINGCCQTVVSMSPNSFCVNVSRETLAVTTFKTLKSGAVVNLERALTPSTRMGGHIVQGHIDCTATYMGNMTFEIPQEESRYVVYKGSITIDGVSLTVAKIENNIFSIAIIPQTLENTNLKYLKTGDIVNIETDILGRYVEKFLSTKNNNITEDFLKENGFI